MGKHKAKARASAALSKIKKLMNSNDKFNEDPDRFEGLKTPGRLSPLIIGPGEDLKPRPFSNCPGFLYPEDL